jgi:hypothetical protein
MAASDTQYSHLTHSTDLGSPDRFGRVVASK